MIEIAENAPEVQVQVRQTGRNGTFRIQPQHGFRRQQEISGQGNQQQGNEGCRYLFRDPGNQVDHPNGKQCRTDGIHVDDFRNFMNGTYRPQRSTRRSFHTEKWKDLCDDDNYPDATHKSGYHWIGYEPDVFAQLDHTHQHFNQSCQEKSGDDDRDRVGQSSGITDRIGDDHRGNHRHGGGGTADLRRCTAK